MDNIYLLKETKITKLLQIIDQFDDRMERFNEKYNNMYTYDINVYKDYDEEEEKIYVAEINIKSARKHDKDTDFFGLLD